MTKARLVISIAIGLFLQVGALAEPPQVEVVAKTARVKAS